MKIYICILLIFSFLSCSHNAPSRKSFSSKDIEAIYSKLQTLEVDSFRNIEAEWRNVDALYLRYHWSQDTLDFGFPILLKKTSENCLSVRYNDTWISLDSTFSMPEGLHYERIIFCFNVMEKLDILKINNGVDSNVMFVTIDTLRFYYIFDNKYFNDHSSLSRLRKIDNNWWIEE
jgi:hypothetical protein